MKKNIKIISLLLVLVLALCACGSKTSGENQEFNYSTPFDENGYWKGITASEYVTLPDIENIELSQTDMDAEIQELLEYYHDDVEVMDREIVDGDTVNIDYVGSIDGVEFEGGNTNGNGTKVTIGVTSYIDDFLEQLIGHKPGENFDIEVTFPDPYENNPDYSGKDAIFNITINSIIEEEIPEFNDDFVKKNFEESNGWTSTKDIEENLLSYLVEDYLLAGSTYEKDVPETMMDYQKETAIAYYQQYADSYNMDLNDFLSYFIGVSDTEELWEAQKEEAEEFAKSYLTYQAIAEKMNYVISDEDLTSYFNELGTTITFDEAVESYGKPYLKFIALNDTIVDKVQESATIEIK